MFRACLLFILFFTGALSAEPIYLPGKFQEARSGDYIVTAHDNTYSLLRLRSVTNAILTLEEVSIPSSQLDAKSIDWKNWLSQKAPGHTAWTLYEIDLKRGEVLECFSCSKNGWILLESQEQFFAKLLTLPFTVLADAQKKKIGPPPAAGETDHRKTWSPPLILEGKKINRPLFDVLRSRWPDDNTQLSSCAIDLYFDAEHPQFPFPYWIEVKSPHYALKIQTIASGHDLPSPLVLDMPRRPPEIIGVTQKTSKSWSLPLRVPLYHDALHLFAIDLTTPSRTTLAIPHRLERQSKEEAMLKIEISELKNVLTPEHRYQWAIQSDKTPTVYVHSDEIFLWRE